MKSKEEKQTNLNHTQMQEIFKYSIGELVYHITPDTPRGVIISRRTYPDIKLNEYLVGFGYEESGWVNELEISRDKQLEL